MIAHPEDWSKEQLVQAIKMVARTWVITDGIYFQTIEDKWGLDEAVKADMKMWERVTVHEARKIRDIFQINEKGPLAIAKALDFVTFSMLDGFELAFEERTPERVVFAWTRCAPQEARLAQGRGEFPCKPVGCMFLEKMIEVFDPEVTLQCHICPPDPHPDNIWCKWELAKST